ncbi:sperm acrosome membrane-associated protein 4-like isoform X1 [Ictalurus furcatus]|uniref:sperm acrosome membrane-associated protein 4-like isoform X1 n=1 Tax=Ictalurus furcatus TaxID=66913 RepID=UPI0023505A81|nr:sperm acrosome membrane-associated protein 4-like isoform X1 [Ictalurus furcatus]
MVIMSSSTALLSFVLLSLLSSTAVCLTCYKCVFPNVSPLDCQQVPKKCAEGERCLHCTSKAVKDSVTFVLKDKGCAKASECGITGQKRAAGLVFTYTTHCCDTDLCNAVAPLSTPYWRRTALSLCGTVLAVLLASV